ncbi:MAG: HNH endonuclease [Fibrobacteres bacterium]|nr:HNH endonuclease [Fibrobacterota bacterium]
MFNAVRSHQVPTSLAQKRAYNQPDVINALMNDFHKKCYLCESINIKPFEIDHLVPHENIPSKKYEWQNLFLACRRCNGIKSDKHTDIIDCCNASVNVADEIRYTLPSAPDQKILISKNTEIPDATLDNTIRLLDDCYNLANTKNREVSRSQLIEEMFTEYTILLQNRCILMDRHSSEFEKSQATEKIKAMTHDSFPFSAFWKWYVKFDGNLKQELAKYT